MAITDKEQRAIDRAIKILDREMRIDPKSLTSPFLVRRFLRLHLEPKEFECFGVIFLDSQNRVIEFKIMFTGTIDRSSVYPREVVKEALKQNAANLVIAHNHPSGISTPSDADRRITQRLQSALELIDVQILDHMVIGKGGDITSFKEQDWI